MDRVSHNDESRHEISPWYTSRYRGGLLVGGFTGVLVGPLAGVVAGLIAALIHNWLHNSSDGTTLIYLPFLIMVVMVFVGAILGICVGLYSASQGTSAVRIIGALVFGVGTGWLLSLGEWLFLERMLAFGGACSVTAFVVENRVAAAIWVRGAKAA